MKSLIPMLLILPVGFGLSAFNGDSVGDTLLMYAGIVLLLASCIALLSKARGHVFRHVGVYLASIGIFILIGLTHFPFRATFSLSEPALNRLAMSVEAGEPLALPHRVGLFTIREAGKKDDGSIYLWTDPSPSGPSGFVYHYNGKGYNLWSELRLDDDWYFICED
jgi:hypothetical protein